VFPEITIERLDGYDEIYRKLSDRLNPLATLSAWRARITGFAHADENGRADLSAQLLSNLLLSREAVIITDHDGLLDGDGAFQAAVEEYPATGTTPKSAINHFHRTEDGAVSAPKRSRGRSLLFAAVARA
jgi:hypothetical protein